MDILVISNNPFSKVLNNGKTFESLFSFFPKEQINQLFFRPMGSEYDDYDYAHSSYAITDGDVVNRLLHKCRKCGREVQSVEKEIGSTTQSQKRNWKSYFGRINKYMLLRDYLWAFGFWKTKDLDDWIKKIKPDVVFLACGNMKFPHSIAWYICDSLNIPLVTYFGDDYLLNPSFKTVLEKIQHRRIKRFWKESVERSKICYGIGDELCKSYSAYFKRDFSVLRTPVKVTPIIEEKDNNPLVISYFGGLHLNRWKMICELSEKLKFEKIIKVYTMSKLTEEMKNAFAASSVQYMGGVSGDDLEKAIIDSNVLLHVESDDKFNRSITKLSVSTKIPEYLNAGRLILGYGPSEVASMKLIVDNEVGVYLSSEHATEEEYERTKETILSETKRESWGKKAHDYVSKNFDEKVVGAFFTTSLQTITQKQ